MPTRMLHRVAAYVIPIRDNQVLMAQRHNTGFGDGRYSFVAGHVEEGESITGAAIREAKEEANLLIEPADLRFAHVLHRRSDDQLVYIDFFFVATRWEGTPTIQEPHRCSDLLWASPEELPDETLPYIRDVIEQVFVTGGAYSELGWTDKQDRAEPPVATG